MAEADPMVPAADTGPDASKSQQGSRVLRTIGKTGLAILILVFAAWLVLFITKGRFLKHTFERYASKSLQRDLRVGGDFQLYLNPVSIKFYAEGLTIANPAWRGGDLFKSDKIDTRISLAALIFGTQRIKWLNMEGATADLAWDAERKRNTFTFGDPNKPGKPFRMPEIVQAQIIKTRIAYLDPLFQLKTDIDVQTVKASDTRFADDIRFTGRGTLRQRPFTMSGSILSPNETIAGGENKLRLAALSGATALDVSGTLPGATVIEGARLKLLVRGRDFADLLAFLGVAVPHTRTYRFTSDMTKHGDAWRFTRLGGFFGESDLAGGMTISLPDERLRIDADLATRKLDIVDAGPFIGYDPDRLATGQVSETVGGTPRLLPDAPLEIEAIKRFDAHVNYKVTTIRAPNLPVSNVALRLDLDRSLLKLSPLTMNLSGGNLWSDISINARTRPVHTAYDIRLSPTPMGKLLGRFGVEQSGTSGVVKARIKMEGDGDSVRKSLATSNGRIAIILPRGSFWARNIQLSEIDVGTYLQKLIEKRLKDPVQINCGLIGFTVRNGIAAADPILIDTEKNVMISRGGFSFRNEAIDLTFRADSKKFSILAGQSPVALNGYFAKPGFDPVSPELFGRAGAGLGLAVLASPLAAVVAFVDVGDAKSAQCGPVLAGATAKAQRTTKGEPRDDVGSGTTAKAENGKSSPQQRGEQRRKFLGIF